MRRILVVDDEPTLCSAVAARLRADGFVVETAAEGPGIAPGERERVFGRGESADGGTGLGLAIARWAVELHGGTIDVADRTPGCRIRVLIPQQEGDR